MAVILMKGNEAIGEAAIIAGCRHYFGYPITPQNELPAYMAARLPKVGGTFLQAESEVAAINMVFGAAAAGARVMTSSSSPGVSLKMEGISYLAGAELPGGGREHDARRPRSRQHRRGAGGLLPGGQGRRARGLPQHRPCPELRPGAGGPHAEGLRPCRPVPDRGDPARRRVHRADVGTYHASRAHGEDIRQERVDTFRRAAAAAPSHRLHAAESRQRAGAAQPAAPGEVPR